MHSSRINPSLSSFTQLYLSGIQEKPTFQEKKSDCKRLFHEAFAEKEDRPSKEPSLKKAKISPESSKITQLGKQLIAKEEEIETEKGKEKEIQFREEELEIVRQIHFGEGIVISLSQEQEQRLMNLSDYFRMIFTCGLSSQKVDVFVDLSKDEQAPIKEKILELIQAIKDNKSYGDWRGSQTQAVLGNDDFEDLIIWREAAIFLGMTSYIQEINRFCLEIAVNNPDGKEKLKQFSELLLSNDFQSDDFKNIYTHILNWTEIWRLLDLNECYRSDSVNIMLTFLKQNAKQNPIQTLCVLRDDDEEDFELQISNLVQFYPNLKTLVVKSPVKVYFELSLFFNKKNLGLENLGIKRLMIDFLFTEFYEPDELHRNFPHLEELYFASSIKNHERSHFTNVIIENDCFKKFARLNKIVVYECCETQFIEDVADGQESNTLEYDNTIQVYLRSNDTHKFIGLFPDEESNSSDSEDSDSASSDSDN